MKTQEAQLVQKLRDAGVALHRAITERDALLARRHEAIAILHRAIGVDGWGWLLTDPGARLPVHVCGENRVVDQALPSPFRVVVLRQCDVDCGRRLLWRSGRIGSAAQRTDREPCDAR